MRVSEKYDKHFLDAADVADGDLVLEIVDVAEDEKVGDKRVDIITFKDGSRLILNKTNAEQIAELLGDDSDDWLGHSITLYAAMAEFNKRPVRALRVRSKLPLTEGNKAHADQDVPFE